MSHVVTQSTHDIGVLVALGARPGNIIRLVVRQGMQLAGVGIAVSVVGAAALTHVARSGVLEISSGLLVNRPQSLVSARWNVQLLEADLSASMV